MLRLGMFGDVSGVYQGCQRFAKQGEDLSVSGVSKGGEDFCFATVKGGGKRFVIGYVRKEQQQGEGVWLWGCEHPLG